LVKASPATPERTVTEPASSAQVDDRPRRAASDSEVARRAYDIYLSRGGGDGRDLDDWLQAKRELSGREGQ
jgi:hypothetical protein